MPGKKIFISYSRADGEKFALKIANDLKNAGVNVWVDQINISLGKMWDTEIETALGSAECILFIATEKSTASVNVLNEVYYALEENKQVIPVIASDCKLPFRLKRLQYIDFTADYDNALKKLLGALHAADDAHAEPLNKETAVLPPVEKEIPKPPVVASPIVAPPVMPEQKKEPVLSQQVSMVPASGMNRRKMMPLITGAVVVVLALVAWLVFKNGSSGEKELTNSMNTDNDAFSEIETLQQRNEKIVRESIEAINAGNIEAFAKDMSPDIIDYGDYSGPPIKGIDSVKITVRIFLTAFPDYRGSNIRTMAQGDSVVVHARWTGTFKYNLPAYKATGKIFDYEDKDVYKFDAQGKIISHSNSPAGLVAFLEVIKDDNGKNP